MNSKKSKLLVVKIGGNVIDDAVALHRFLDRFSKIASPKILVHGGGKIATKIGEQLNIVSNYVNGRRITDDATIDLVTMVYGGLVNKKIVAALQALHCNALGMSGADANLLAAQKRPVKEIDYGWVGDIVSDKVNVQVLHALLQEGIVPVVAPLTHDVKGHLLNTNADTIAACLAEALSALYEVRLIYCFEKKGVLYSIEDEQNIIEEIAPSSYQNLLQSGQLFAGIIPKVESALHAVAAGVKTVIIGSADDIEQNISDIPAGTAIVGDSV